MCDSGTSSKIPRGFDKTKSFGLVLTLLSTIVCDTRGIGSLNTEVPKVTGRSTGIHFGIARVNTPMEMFDNDKVLVGHSGDPWGIRNESENSRHSKIRSRSAYSSGGAQEGSNDRVTAGRRSRRSVVHLYNMVVCATGCNPVSYKGYGCYCGFLGSGTAVDGIDRCCRMHDRCYYATECPTFLEYFVPYYWKCYHGYRPICAVEHGKWGGSGSCAQRLCECDRALSECLRRFPCPTSKAVCTTSPWRLIQNVFMIF